MFITIKLHLAMFEDGFLTEEQLSGWLRFHTWAQGRKR